MLSIWDEILSTIIERDKPAQSLTKQTDSFQRKLTCNFISIHVQVVVNALIEIFDLILWYQQEFIVYPLLYYKLLVSAYYKVFHCYIAPLELAAALCLIYTMLCMYKVTHCMSPYSNVGLYTMTHQLCEAMYMHLFVYTVIYSNVRLCTCTMTRYCHKKPYNYIFQYV